MNTVNLERGSVWAMNVPEEFGRLLWSMNGKNAKDPIWQEGRCKLTVSEVVEALELLVGQYLQSRTVLNAWKGTKERKLERVLSKFEKCLGSRELIAGMRSMAIGGEDIREAPQDLYECKFVFYSQ